MSIWIFAAWGGLHRRRACHGERNTGRIARHTPVATQTTLIVSKFKQILAEWGSGARRTYVLNGNRVTTFLKSPYIADSRTTGADSRSTGRVGITQLLKKA